MIIIIDNNTIDILINDNNNNNNYIDNYDYDNNHGFYISKSSFFFPCSNSNKRFHSNFFDLHFRFRRFLDHLF